MTDAPVADRAFLPIRVMVVDDSALTRISLKTSLKQHGTSVCFAAEAENGQDALYKLKTVTPDVVLMDIGMPVMDGITATQHIKAQYPAIKVIMITSHEEQTMVLDAFQSGAHSYCLKETSPEMLVHVILSTAHGACWIDPETKKSRILK
jgi:two-component system, NarL family, response regulator LiaR